MPREFAARRPTLRRISRRPVANVRNARVAHRETIVRSGGMCRALNKALLGGVSLLALITVSDLGEARSLTPTTDTVAPTAAAQQAAIAAALQAAGAANQAQVSLARASAALAAARKIQLD